MTRYRPVKPGALVEACAVAGIAVRQAQSKSQYEWITRQRFHVMSILRSQGASYLQIGKALGGRDHATIIHGVRRWAEIQAVKVAAE